MDSPPGQNVLLGAMAQSLYADRQSPEDGRAQGPRGSDGAKLPRVVAPGAHRSHATRYVQQVAGTTGRGLRQGPLGLVYLSSVNRPVRTRMLGGVGGGGENPPPTRLGVASHRLTGRFLRQV